MSLDPRIEPLVSPLTDSLFPAFYRETAPVLVDFVRAFFDFMETEGPTFHARRILDYQDVDATTSAILPHLRAKYLRGIVLSDDATRRLIKHCLDLYRSRGTPRAIDLFFRLAYGVGASVYNPSRDLFRTSDGRWILPYYLEVSLDSNLPAFVGRVVTGNQSGARAFVERAFRKNVEGKIVQALSISGIEGSFITGEVVTASSGSQTTIVGSLSRLLIEEGAFGFETGDILTLDGGSGRGGVARVASAANESLGTLSLVLQNGGYGYTLNAECIVADVLVLSNVAVDRASNPTNNYFFFLETLTQNAATARVVSERDRVTLTLTNDTPANAFFTGETVTSNSGAYAVVQSSTGQDLVVASRVGVFGSGDAIVGSTSDARGNLEAISVGVGIDTISGSFATGNVLVYSSGSNTRSSAVVVAGGTGATFVVSSLTDVETVEINDDYIYTYANVYLGANSYGFPADPTGNLSTSIGNCLTYLTENVGRVQAIRATDMGLGYSLGRARIYEPLTYGLRDASFRLQIANASASFTTDEMITQSSTGARGYVVSLPDAITGEAVIRRASLFKDFAVTTNATSQIVGVFSGSTANVIAVGTDDANRPLDVGGAFSGADAVINAQAAASNGVATELDVVISGFGYVNGDILSFASPDGGGVGTAIAYTETEGVGAGYYGTMGSMPSSGKHLHDGYYWQTMSYEIRAAVSPDAYDAVMNALLHRAGTARFGKFQWSSECAIGFGGFIDDLGETLAADDWPAVSVTQT